MSKTAIIFPGQGAQAVGMGKELVDADPSLRVWFDRASELLGFDLAQVCFEGPAEELTRSDRAQPAIFVMSIVAWEALKAKTAIQASAVAGLSSGEWAALCVGGVVSFEDTIRILEARGRMMQQACEATDGGMLSIIGLADDIVAEIAAEAGVEVANFNSPGQVVLSGSKAGIAAAEPIAKEKKARMAIPLPVAGAFHSSLMQSAADEFAAFLAEIDFKSPEVPVLSNVTGIPHENIDSIRTRMAEQITGSVQWVKNAQWLLDNGITTMVECGPGKVLSGLVKRIDKTASLHSVNDSGSLEATVDALSTND